jgi:hypothetical protein
MKRQHLLVLPFLSINAVAPSAEKQSNAPQTGKTYKCVDYAAEYCALPAKQPSDQVKLKQTD